MESAQELSFLTTLLPAAVIVFVIAVGVIFLNQHFRKNLYRQMLEQEELKNNHNHDLLRSAIEVQEVERKRIAQDLHDEIGVLLTTSKIYFNQLEPKHSEEQLNVVRNKMNLLFDEMITNIRRISHDLRPIILENLGLIEAIESLDEKLSEVGIKFYFSHELSFNITKDAELILYRIIQELIGNTLKHAGATSIFIDIKVHKSIFYLHYKDNGAGFNPEKAYNGLGMKSIESRLNLLHGKMEIMKPDKGSYFLIDINTQSLNGDEQH